MKQQIYMIPDRNLNLRLAHKDTLKEIYLRLARMIYKGTEIKRVISGRVL